ncbi:FAD-dependent oxidoreductase [Mumia sp.]|uniref:NAD(P)/FAD-dependent oxidoreductase n=1 Tax=Mumia sp. TaxID=1965300 RepID=UPI00261DC74A|nr:FAD-dependent oxidoreductase [Mumia sp.]MDD9350309.1 FAD-dependent oxidoreductase [Mumia sp.]
MSTPGSAASASSTPQHVVVAGAGMVGLSTAWFLQERGVQVTVVDRAGVAAGSSWGNAGWISPALTLPLPEPAVLSYGLKAMLSPSSPVYVPLTADPKLLRFLVGFARNCTPKRWRSAMAVFAALNRDALGAYDVLGDGGVAGHAVDEPIQDADPFLAGFSSVENRTTLVEELAHVVSSGGSVDYDLLSGEEIRSLEPTLGDGVRAGVRMLGQRYVNPPAYVASLAESVVARGGEIRAGFDVKDVLDLGPRGVEVLARTGERLRADAVVLATGTWLGDLARAYGVKRVVQAGRGYSFTVVPEQMPKNPIYFPVERVACTPLGDRLRVAGTMEFRDPDAPLEPARIEAIVASARPMFTGVDWDARQEEWVGSRPCTTDGLPLVGATRSPRVHVAGGHGMWGIALGPLTGRMVADAMTGRQAPAYARHLDPLR